MNTTRLTLAIYELGCWGSGAWIVERALTRALGVTRVYVNPATEMAYIEYDPLLTDPSRLITAVERAGFRAGEPRLR
jgi:hypothetical protein